MNRKAFYSIAATRQIFPIFLYILQIIIPRSIPIYSSMKKSQNAEETNFFKFLEIWIRGH